MKTTEESNTTYCVSFQLADSLWTDPGLKSGINARELMSMSTLRKRKGGKKKKERKDKKERQKRKSEGGE